MEFGVIITYYYSVRYRFASKVLLGTQLVLMICGDMSI
jgi:hypothetical protein